MVVSRINRLIFNCLRRLRTAHNCQLVSSEMSWSSCTWHLCQGFYWCVEMWRRWDLDMDVRGKEKRSRNWWVSWYKLAANWTFSSKLRDSGNTLGWIRSSLISISYELQCFLQSTDSIAANCFRLGIASESLFPFFQHKTRKVWMP